MVFLRFFILVHQSITWLTRVFLSIFFTKKKKVYIKSPGKCENVVRNFNKEQKRANESLRLIGSSSIIIIIIMMMMEREERRDVEKFYTKCACDVSAPFFHPSRTLSNTKTSQSHRHRVRASDYTTFKIRFPTIFMLYKRVDRERLRFIAILLVIQQPKNVKTRVE
jgi:hypothetical protein